MKYASEVIDLLGHHPSREFRMMEIVNFIIGAGQSREEREVARKAVRRVLKVLEDCGSISVFASHYPRGGYSTYRMNSVEHPQGARGPAEMAEVSLRERAYAKTSNEGLPDPYRAFEKHKTHAATRGIEFAMTFKEWWDFWEDNYHRRGSKPDDLCMARHGDVGPYSADNVYITTNRDNLRDYRLSKKCGDDKAALRAKRKQHLQDLIAEMESLPPPQYSYEQVIGMLSLGVSFQLRPNAEVGHQAARRRAE